MIAVKNLSFKYKKAANYAIRCASCEVDASGIIAIVGKSAVGKSTFISLLSGVYRAQDELVGALEGSIMLQGLRPDQLRGPNIVSWVPQQPMLLDHLTVIQNIMLPLTITRMSAELKERCVLLMERLGIGSEKDARVRELSGGQKTRVSFARALVSRPRYLFLDEPFISLDVATRWSMYQLLCEQRKDDGLCTVITTHDIPEAMLLADRVLVMGMSGDTTTLEVISNDPPALEGGQLENLLIEARKRAPAVECRIYQADNIPASNAQLACR